MTFEQAFARFPLVAILRGLTPETADAIGDTLVESGFTLIEVPLNSPRPLDSIERLSSRLGTAAVLGAGTVLDPADVARVQSAGGSLIISPDCNPAVIAEAASRQLIGIPGIATPSEAFAALRAGATALKLFPAEAASPAVLKAMRAVLPTATRVLPVGGITPANMAPWLAAGAAGFGLGSALFRPGLEPSEVATNAADFRTAWDNLRQA
ncbi:2-dehydro-3-deoxy-6-phosphogalactonate aldolase [Sandaracinobacteroides hominis]|uniref:2-dehydro-3-deoxy-6-phosphogalactonate aldolase n=1 Tax=Sandaracinobacteroides hominis TaxID=2780086 RepID=UPI0018F452C4|nr:2-dehydro-3-deoxy-6-phosphogalactonate aldolase [Sandaracinobacteroides hominis]